MTSLSTLYGGGDSGGAGTDPLQEGYPVVAIYGGSFNDNSDVRLHRVHSGELVGSPWGAITNSTASYQHGQANMHMFGYNSDYGNLDGNLSSQDYGSYNQFTMSLYQNDHYPYSWFGSASKDGRMGFQSFHSSDHYRKYYRRINVISLPGRRPRRQFNLNNTRFTETGFNSSYGGKSSIDFNTNSNEYWGGTAPGSNTSYGSACYNQRTKTMAIYYAESSGSDNGRIYMYRGTKDLMSETECPTVKDFFDNCTINYIRINSVTNWGYDTINYNVNLVLGDNDFVGVNTRYSSENRYCVYDCTPTTDQTSAITSAISPRSEGNTTSYGPEQGMMYRARMQLSWDTDWAMLYGPYYYYGCGLSAYTVSVKDPRKMSYVNIGLTDYGGGLFPSGRSGFKWLTGYNTDGEPIQNWSIELGQTGHVYTENFKYFHGNRDCGDSNYEVANWTGTMVNSYGYYAFQYPGYYYSTSYPRFMSVNWWEQQGAYSQ
jgi:hypothetical protein